MNLVSPMEPDDTGSNHSPLPHQHEVLDAVDATFTAGQRRHLLHLAPGAGKTLIANCCDNDHPDGTEYEHIHDPARNESRK